MGNGQCEVCYACGPRRGFSSAYVGHERRCKLAKSIESLGGKVEWKRKNTSKRYKATLRFFAPFEAKLREEVRKILAAT